MFVSNGDDNVYTIGWCVCVCEKERERECVCVYVKEICAKESKIMRVNECVRPSKRVVVCVCMC